MTDKIDIQKQYHFETLHTALMNEQLSPEEWVTVFTRIYPKAEGLSSAANVSFFAREINSYRQARMTTEWSSKAAVTAVMVGGLLWLDTLAVTTMIGCASATVLLLNVAITFFSPIIFDPKIGFPEGHVKLTDAQQESWSKYRKTWLNRVESAELSKDNQYKQALTRNVGIGLVTTFAAGLVLTTQVMSLAIVANLMAYVVSLALSPGNQQLVEGYADAPSEELSFSA